MTVSCGFSLGGYLNFLDFLQKKFYNIDCRRCEIEMEGLECLDLIGTKSIFLFHKLSFALLKNNFIVQLLKFLINVMPLSELCKELQITKDRLCYNLNGQFVILKQSNYMTLFLNGPCLASFSFIFGLFKQ